MQESQKPLKRRRRRKKHYINNNSKPLYTNRKGENMADIKRDNVDGRRTETHFEEKSCNSGITERTTTHYEEVVPMEMRKRVVERVVPVIVERVTEQFNGNKINRTVEKVDSIDLHKPVEKPLTKADVESLLSKFHTSSAPIHRPEVIVGDDVPVVSDPEKSKFVGLILLVLLAAEVGWLVWQLFMK
jgi:hypothetical protein